MVFSIVFNEMVNKRGYTKGWGLRVIGFVQLFLFAVSILTIKGRLPKNLGIKLTSFPFLMALKDLKFSLFCLASLTGFLGLYIPYCESPLSLSFFPVSTLKTTVTGFMSNSASPLADLTSAFLLSSFSLRPTIRPSYRSFSLFSFLHVSSSERHDFGW